MGNISIVNKFEMDLDGKKAMIFHGDVFDVIIQNSKWLAKLGSIGYDSLIVLNTFLNFIVRKMGREQITLSKVIKDNIKQAVKYIGDFEKTAAETAARKGFHFVVCGHIHQPQKRIVQTEFGEVIYLNSGDWIENLSSLEYHKGEWKVYHYSEDKNVKHIENQNDETETYMADFENKELFNKMLSEFAQFN
jgi:UDP-2,3-diacylglucosamine pyrophosphatase LpxH